MPFTRKYTVNTEKGFALLNNGSTSKWQKLNILRLVKLSCFNFLMYNLEPRQLLDNLAAES